MKGNMLAATLVLILLASTPSRAWEYSQDKDEMTGKTTRFACVVSENILDFQFPYNGGTSAQLCLRVGPRWGSSVILQVFKGQFLCHDDDCNLRVKFNSEAPVTFDGSDAADGSMDHIFIDQYSRFVAATRKAKMVLVGARFFQDGEKVIRFDVSNLSWK